MQPETKFKEWLRPRLDKIPQGYFVKIQQLSIRGIPDFFGVIAGRFVALELKVGKNSASTLQSYVLRRVAKAGGIALVVHPDNVTEVLSTLYALGGWNADEIRENKAGFSYLPKVRGK